MKKNIKKIIPYLVLISFGYIFIYPFLFLVSSAFKTNEEILLSTSLIPRNFSLESFVQGWKGVGNYSFDLFFINTFKMVIPIVVLTVISCTLAAYGFARFKFRLRNILFFLMISTLMLPDTVMTIPKYMMFNRFGWMDTYWPFIIPSAFATNSFFIFLMVQFLRNIPKELDESAVMDGCNSFTLLCRIILPLCKPAMFSICIFQFVGTWNSFFTPLIYINSVKKYTLSLALRLTIDPGTQVQWSNVMAMSLLSMLPCILIYFFAQKYFVEGITTTGIKG